MKRYLCILFVLFIAVLILFNPTLASDSGNSRGKVLKTKMMSGSQPHFPNMKTFSQSEISLGTLPTPAFLSKGRIIRADSREGKLLHIFSESGLKAEFIAPEKNNTLSFVRGDLGHVSRFRSASVEKVKSISRQALSSSALLDAQAALGWLNTFSSALGIEDAINEFVVNDYFVDTFGKRHVRFQQVYHDIPVWAEEIYVHIDEKGRFYAVNGQYEATPTQIENVMPSISADQAFENAKIFLITEDKWHPISSEVKKLLSIPEPSVEKVVWFDRHNIPHLVWFVDVYANYFDWFYIFIDAHNGQVLHAINNKTLDGFVDASGIDLHNATQHFRAYQKETTYYMLSDVNEMRSSSSDLPHNPAGGLFVLDLRNNDLTEESDLYYVTSTNPTSWSEASAVSVIAHAKAAYDYYRTTHNRRGFDDKASTIMSIIGLKGENAFWFGAGMAFGNGGTNFKPLAGGLDVVAHELTHGVTQATANIIYQDQSGALNESMSDFFAAMVDRDDWLMGEDVMQSGHGIALRDIANPANPNVFSPLPENMDQYVYTTEDNGGVHINMSIPCRAAYLIANSIGREKTEKMYYRALTTYLTRQSVFIDCRNAVEQAAVDLYGTTELDAVKAAFDMVKITSGGGYDPGDDDLNPTTGGSQWIAFIRDDLQIGLYDIDGGVDYYLPDVRVKAVTGNYAQITATADGGYLYFVNENGNIGFVYVGQIPTSGQFSYGEFDDIYVQTPGDLWNVAVSRDNAVLAFTSEYQDDNNVYFYIDNEIYYVELDMATDQQGVERNTIQYADVLDWSPNCQYRKLAFDAYNALTLQGGQTRNWWSMGEVDFASMEIYELLPAQPDGVSTGNVEYSSTNPDIIVFNYIDPDNHWDIMINDYDHPENSLTLTFPDRDVERPSLSPDDRRIVVDRFSDHSLLICSLADLTLYPLAMEADAYYPEWFVIGGDYDLEVENTPQTVPYEFTLSQNYPNPFNPITTIHYTLSEASDVNITIFNIRGQKIKSLVDQRQNAGAYRVIWDGTNNAGISVGSGVYFYTLSTENSQTLTRKMIFIK